MRPRIRTIKPEMWADEKVGDLSHGARLLFVGLITMADDEGRLRELPAAILGHVFPYDNVTPAKLARWLGEIERSGMVMRYQVAGKRYLAFPHWADHQKVDRPNESDLPAPPVSDDPSPNGSSNHSTNNRRSVEDHSRPPRAGADPIRSDPVPGNPLDQGESRPGRAPSKRADPNQIPASLPAELHDPARQILSGLLAVHAERGGDEPTLRGVGLAMVRYPDRDHVGVLRELEHWALAGRGQSKRVADWPRTFATFLGHAPVGRPPVVAGAVFGGLRVVPGGNASPDYLIRKLNESEAL